MKAWIFRLFLFGALIAAGIWGWTVIFPGPEKVIRKRLLEVADLASIRSNEAPLARLSNSQKLANYAAPDVSVAINVPGRSQWTIEGRGELAQVIMSVRSHTDSLDVEFLDIVVNVAKDRQSATVNLTAKGQSHSRSGDFGVQELRFVMKKISGSWLISKVETVRTLS